MNEAFFAAYRCVMNVAVAACGLILTQQSTVFDQFPMNERCRRFVGKPRLYPGTSPSSQTVFDTRAR